MNKELLIQKITKLLDVDESQSNLAFKIFISKVSEYLRPNQAISLPQIGVFQMQQNSITIKGIEGLKYSNKDNREKIIFSPVPFELNSDLTPNFILIDIIKREEIQELKDKFFEVGVSKPAISIDKNFSIEIDDDSKFKTFINNVERKTLELLRGSQVLKNFDIEKDYFKLTRDDIISENLTQSEEELNLDSIFDDDELLDDESIIERPNEKVHDTKVIKNRYERSPVTHNELKVLDKTFSEEKMNDEKTLVFGEEKEAISDKIIDEELYDDERHISKKLKYFVIALGTIAIGLIIYFYVIPDRYRYKIETFLGIRDVKKTNDSEITHTKTPVNLIDTTETIKQLTPDISHPNSDETVNKFSNIPEKKEPIKTTTNTMTESDYSYTINDKLVFFENGYYTIQVGAYKSRTNAEKLVKGLKSKGHDAYILSSQTSQGSVLYKVRIGKFSSRQEAEDYTKKI